VPIFINSRRSVIPIIHDELKIVNDTIKNQRDEINLQLHLAKENIKDELDELERSWNQLVAKMAEIAKEADNVGRDILQSAKELGHHIKEGYDKIKAKI
jgi:hypothetical protein